MTPTERKVMEQALEMLASYPDNYTDRGNQIVADLRAALAEPTKNVWRCPHCNTDLETEHASTCPIEMLNLGGLK